MSNHSSITIDKKTMQESKLPLYSDNYDPMLEGDPNNCDNTGDQKLSDEFERFGLDVEDIKTEAEHLIKQGLEADISADLKKILETRNMLKEIIASEIKFSEPVLRQGDNAVIFPHTINVIQGQAGVHKSRLAETICAAFLKLSGNQNELLGFNRQTINATHTVVYVDTERNLSEQLPFALQSIQMKAGYNKTDNPINFEYISLLQISRNRRFAALNEYLNHIRRSTNNPLFIVLDVSTDCIEDFNKTDKSMELIDLMNIAINEHDVTFLCLIHENPKSDKARGHFGTELMNKASTVMQVGFEKDANQNDTEIIRVKYLKCRSTAKHTPFHFKYNDEAKGLILANPSEVAGIISTRKQKANNEDMVDAIELYLGDGAPYARQELLDFLCGKLGASVRTIENRIIDLMRSNVEFFNKQGQNCTLSKELKEKNVYYKLTPTELT
jgi:hypothetical protein